jgi:hypothetical protein
LFFGGRIEIKTEDSMSKFKFEGYARLLKNWIIFSQKHLYFCPERKGLVCYGNGISSNWGVQTNLKAMSAFAVAACMEEFDFSDTSITKEKVLEQALGMLRYALSTHLEGDFVCTNGEKWGHSWIYALGIERMFHAIELLEKHLTDEDNALLKNVMLSESEFILNDYPIVAGLVENNKPESNIWNGAILYRTAVLYPDCENRDKYLEKAYKFFANGISIESDENSDKVLGGNRIGDLFVGANMFDSYACNHHRYLNFGYMNICLSNIAMLHFFLKGKNVKANGIIYHNLKEQWRLCRSAIFDDGRLIRVGGDTRARYSYCQDYAFVAWSLIEDVFGEDCSELENRWLETLEAEAEANKDGSFLSNRVGYFESTSPLYYTRLESDRANAISLVLYWHKKYNLDCSGKSEKLSLWSDEYHGAAFVSSDTRFASFAWRAAEHPQGLLLPPTDSTLAEWKGNLTGRVFGTGLKNADEVEKCKVETFNSGFLTSGASVCISDDFGEGQPMERLARKQIAYAALPDGKTTLCLQYAKAINRVFLAESAGVFWNIPNDIFNGRKRCIYFKDGSKVLVGGDLTDSFETVPLGKYINVENKVGIASISPLTLVRRGKRQIGIKGRQNSGVLYCEEVCSEYREKPYWTERGAVIFDTGFAAKVGNAEETRAMNDSVFSLNITEEIKGIGAVGADGKKYLLLANFNNNERKIDLKKLELRNVFNVKDGTRVESFVLKSCEAMLLFMSE